MEQVFIIIAVLVFWIFKGVAGPSGECRGRIRTTVIPLSPDAPRDVVGATRQQTLEAQQRAIEALQRWEEEQGLSAGERDPAWSASADLVPAASRTRSRAASHDQRSDGGQSPSQGSLRRHRANVGSGATRWPDCCQTDRAFRSVCRRRRLLATGGGPDGKYPSLTGVRRTLL